MDYNKNFEFNLYISNVLTDKLKSKAKKKFVDKEKQQTQALMIA